MALQAESDRAQPPRNLRVGVDMSIVRHPFAGSARWATGILTALQSEDGIDATGWAGPRRVTWGNPARKVANWALDRRWYDVEIPHLAQKHRSDVLFMPVNLVARSSGIPQVVSILDVNFATAPGTYDRAFETYARRQFARSIENADRVITISEFSRLELARTFGIDIGRIQVVYPGLRAARPVSGPRPIERPYALYVGATEPHKNVRLAVEAWRRTPDLDIGLAIVGQPGRAHRDIVRLAAQDPRVTVVGAVDDSTLDSWYVHAEVFVFPSLAEGFGFPPLEAMLRGIPVVAARAGPLPEVLGNAAGFHSPDSWEELADGVIELLSDPVLRARRIAAGSERAARFSWPSSARQLAGVLRSAAGERP